METYIVIFPDDNTQMPVSTQRFPRIGEIITFDSKEKSFKVIDIQHSVKENEITSQDEGYALLTKVLVEQIN